MRIPVATYRIQFNAEFGFDRAKAIVPYLKDLAISDLYASPIFKARPGSTHGYDVVDPTQLNPELGGQASFDALSQTMRQQQLGWLQDIVPNHMAYDSQNRFLMDVLENGPASTYRQYFDTIWNAPFSDRQEPILVPLLGDFYGVCLENGEIQLKYSEAGLSVHYYALELPLKLESYLTFLSYNLGSLARELGRKHSDFIKLLGVLYILKSSLAETTGPQRRDQADFIKNLLWELYSSNPEVKSFFDQNLRVFNGEPGKPDSFNLLDKLLSDQFFRLSYWKVGADEMNYRRFFTVNELISIKVEDPRVFKDTHTLIAESIKQGTFTGLRVDHIDGLYNPTEYLERLREFAQDQYLVVEKILEPGEDLPSEWPIQGTSGYDFLNYANSLFCQTQNREQFDRIYWSFIGTRIIFEQLFVENKQLILEKRLAGDLDNLAATLKATAQGHRYGNDFTINGLKQAIAEVLIRFPVYRTYTTEKGVLESDRPYIQTVIDAAKANAPTLHHELNFLEQLLLLDYNSNLTQTEKEQWLYFVMRLQQYTGPLMAKGIEDTAFYVYNRLISLNEVGGDPSRFGITLKEFHDFNQHRQTHWPHTMNATSTHDTKRGEDVRARINVLSELPDRWRQQVDRWSQINHSHKQWVNGQEMPDRNDEYLIYQTLVGAYPFDSHEVEAFQERMQAYMIKATREAKVFTNWLHPNPAYEEACIQFIQAILKPESPFLSEFLPFQRDIAAYGMFNSLAQTLLKLTAPGVPDLYQGTELWDLSLVDPDNRRPVDFEHRQMTLRTLQAQIQTNCNQLLEELLAHPEDGKVKLFLIYQALQARSQSPDLFLKGDYLALEVRGQGHDRIVAFARRNASMMAVTIVPRFLTDLIQPGEQPLGAIWQDTQVHLPAMGDSTWQNMLTCQPLHCTGQLAVSQALQQFPVALLVSQLGHD